MAVIEASGLRRVVPVTQAHGGWAAVELRRRLGDRVEMIVASSWLVLDPPPPFVSGLQELQDPDRWREGREQLFSMWLTGAPEDVVERVRREMGAYDFDLWSCAGRAITADYARHGNPLRALAEIDPKPNVLHLFSQPRAPEFLAAQETFSAANPWFSVKRLDGVSHFPPLELPDVTAAEIERFIG
jgi:pimeloyl-ACP methyl ester carboxylesterase